MVLGITIIVMAISIITVDAMHTPMLMGVCMAAIMSLAIGFKWSDLEKMMLDGIYKALQSIIILAVVGVLVGVWIQAGVVNSATGNGVPCPLFPAIGSASRIAPIRMTGKKPSRMV